MKKIVLGLAVLLVIAGCKKDGISEPVSSQKDYSFFLSQTGTSFQGKLDNTTFSWRYGWRQFQSIAGFENGNGICDSTDPVRVVLYGLTSEDSAKTRFRLYSPKFNSSSESEVAQVFAVGKKKLGDFRNDFYLSIYKDNKQYQTSSTDLENQIEILKAEEFTDYLGKRLRVWFKLDANLSSCNCQNSKIALTGGLMIVEFYGFKK
jgi:hypothetical protein